MRASSQCHGLMLHPQNGPFGGTGRSISGFLPSFLFVVSASCSRRIAVREIWRQSFVSVPVGGVMGSRSIKNVWQSQSPSGLLVLVPLLGLGYNLGD